LLAVAAGDEGKPGGGGAAPGESAKSASAIHRTMEFIPADAKIVAAMSPSELFKSSATAGVVPMIDAETSGKFGLKFSELADLEAIQSEHGNRFVLRATSPHDWKATLDKLYPTGLEKRSFGGHDYYLLTDSSQRNKAGDLGPAYYLPDDRTIIGGPEEQIQKIIGGNEERMDAAAFPELTASAFALRIDVPSIKQEAGINSKKLEENPLLALILPLLDKSKVARLGVAATGAEPNKENVAARLTLVCDSPEGAGDVAKSLDAARTFAVNVIQAKQKAWQEAASTGAPPEVTKIVTEFVPGVEKSLRAAKIQSEGAVVSADAQIDIGAPTVAAMVLPALAKSKEAAMRVQSMNNMKQLALAMFQYDSSKGHFPAATIVGPDGKTKHSWRIEVLPYLSEKALYDQYHMDEPWNSENNKKLIDRMPDIFRDPHDDPKSTSSSYYMITGKGTVGDDGEGTKPLDIKDGTWQTIMLVDAKRDVPWTKPEDIEIDPDPAKPLPQIGGHMPDGNFAAAFADGHVEILSNSISPKVLRALFTIAGGEVIDRNEMDKPAVQQPVLPRELKSIEEKPKSSESKPRAIEDLFAALANHPNDPQLHNDLAVELARKGRLEEAIAHYQHALQLKPDDAMTFVNLGDALRETGQLKEAEESFKRAASLTKDDDELKRIQEHRERNRSHQADSEK
jgi:hypothetical protein